MKKTKRKGFNFYRSYFDAYQLCESVEEKVEFMDALLNKQFLFQEPNLEDMSRMVKVIYMGQKHSIDKSVDGYCYKTDTPKVDPTEGTSEGTTQGSKEDPTEDPMVRYRSETPMTTEGSKEGSREQEQLEEQLQEKEKEKLQLQLQEKLSFEEIVKKQHLITEYLK